MHLGLNLVSGEIVCSDLTVDDVGDPTALLGLLDQIGGPVEKFIADGAYDGTPTRDLLATRFGESAIAILQKSRPKGGWHGRNPPATTSAVALRPKWVERCDRAQTQSPTF
ncbi:transposase [Rhizobium leguminosarum]|uniref:transposase n=1 Tax=Rhizobium leguminosarum TaxID=384 RepID=UPI0021B10F78|nr:transposase [Rhizobium leguminosarum]